MRHGFRAEVFGLRRGANGGMWMVNQGEVRNSIMGSSFWHHVCVVIVRIIYMSNVKSYSWWTEGEDWRQLRSLTQQHLDQAGQGLEIGCCKRVKGDLMSMWLPSIGCATDDKWSIGFAAKLSITSTGLDEWPVASFGKKWQFRWEFIQFVLKRLCFCSLWIMHIHIILKAYTVRVDGSHPHLVVFFKWH